MSFIERLLVLIEEKGISKNQMLKDLNLGTGIFGTWQSRNSIPNGDTLLKLSKYFGVSIDYILGKTDIKKEPSPELEEKAIFIGQYLLENGIVPDLSDESVMPVLEFLKANEGTLKIIIEKNKNKGSLL